VQYPLITAIIFDIPQFTHIGQLAEVYLILMPSVNPKFMSVAGILVTATPPGIPISG
jgi:hypothetical protein